MIKSTILKPYRFLVLLAGCLGYATAAPYGPDGRETSWTQPGGAELALRVFGDEYYARTETTDGYTVVYNPKDNAYHYAEIAPDGSGWLPTGAIVGLKAPAGLTKHLELPATKIGEISHANRAIYDGDRDQRWHARVQAVEKLRAAANGAKLSAAEAAQASALAAPVLGNKVGLTILAQFPNDPKTGANDPVNFPTDRNKIVRYCNGIGYTENGNTGSIRDYYYDQSLGKVTYTQTVTEIITLPHPRNYYNFSDYPTNASLRGDASRVLITDAVNLLKSQGFDFSSLTLDGQNRAIATNVMFAGQDSGVYAQGLWPQQWNLAQDINVGTTANPINIYKFQITNIADAAPVIGTFCHENGHLLLGYPDIYALTGEGVGEHCLMGSGNYLNGGKTPSPINAYFKDIVGWGNVTDINSSSYITATLPTTGNVAYRIRKPGTSTEFYIAENRGTGDKWAQYSDDKGIAIWHIDETIDGNTNTGSHYEVALMQADGRRDLEKGNNRGDSTDLFDLQTALFTDTTTPNAKWWNGAASSINIQVLTALGAKTNVQFGLYPPDTLIVTSPNGGDVAFPNSTYDITWQSTIKGNVKIALYMGGHLRSVLAADAPDTGHFAWLVSRALPIGNDYSILISSLTNPVPVSDASDGPFSISATFPAGGVLPPGWFQPAGAASSWKVTSSIAYEGPRCLMSTPIGDGKTAAIAYRAKFQAGRVGFRLKVSSEEGFDFARFYIDGVPQVIVPNNKYDGLSGLVDWTYASFPVTAGYHMFKWTYEKDDSYADSSDRAWLDGVILPPTSPVLASQNQAGVDVITGLMNTAFPDIGISSSGTPQVLTIQNIAKANLTNLYAANQGINSASAPNKTVLLPQLLTSIEVIAGRKYLALTGTKHSLGLGNVVVSSNLLDWYSGNQHTTVMIDDGTLYKVRDNTPVTPKSKRYIRLK